MRRVFNGLTRSALVVVVVCVLAVPSAHAASIFDFPQQPGLRFLQRITKVARHFFTSLLGDELSDPKP